MNEQTRATLENFCSFISALGPSLQPFSRKKDAHMNGKGEFSDTLTLTLTTNYGLIASDFNMYSLDYNKNLDSQNKKEDQGKS
jgi:hypothetical protein